MSDQGENYFEFAPGSFPKPDNQGQLELCVRFALAKAIIDGFMRKIFVPGVVIDLDQGEVRSALINEHKDTLGKWPDEFDQLDYQFQDQNDARFWKTKLDIQKVSTFEFEADQQSNKRFTYVLVYPPDRSNLKVLHCVYIDSFDGFYLYCINSHRNNQRPKVPIMRTLSSGFFIYRVDCSATEMTSSSVPNHNLRLRSPVSTSNPRHVPRKLSNGYNRRHSRSRNCSSCERSLQESASSSPAGFHHPRTNIVMSSNTSLNSSVYQSNGNLRILFESNSDLSSVHIETGRKMSWGSWDSQEKVRIE